MLSLKNISDSSYNVSIRTKGINNIIDRVHLNAKKEYCVTIKSIYN